MSRLGRPSVLGTRYGVSTTHYLATEAASHILKQGGNAIDAGISAGISLSVVERHLCDFGGVAPIILHRPGMDAPQTIDGLGRWPRRLDLATYLERYGGTMPEGVARAVTPGAPAAWLSALALHGTMSLEEVLGPAITLAQGFPVFPRLASDIAANADQLRSWPTSSSVFLREGRPPTEGEILVQPELEQLLLELCRVERAHRHQGRQAGIVAAENAFYRGEIAERIARFLAAEGSVLDSEDLADSCAEIGTGVRTTYRGIEVHACGPWSQGPLVPMTLKLLEGFGDLGSFAPEHPRAIHRFAEAMKLTLADREGFFGDPDFVDVPMRGLLDAAYLAARRELLDEARAHPTLPPPGDPWPYEGRSGRPGYRPKPTSGSSGRDTAYVCVLDAHGNAFSATPSDDGLTSPLVPGLGIAVSTRGSQLWLDPKHPSAIEPGKRPRLTPNPALLMCGGRALMPFGCPGGDAQTQAMVQVAINILDRGLSLQEAIERPRVVSYCAPDSFYPHGSEPGVLGVEANLPESVVAELARLGHRIRTHPRFSASLAAVCAVRRRDDGALEAGADPRRESQAITW